MSSLDALVLTLVRDAAARGKTLSFAGLARRTGRSFTATRNRLLRLRRRGLVTWNGRRSLRPAGEEG